MATGWVWDERYMWHDSRTYADWLPPEALFEPEPSLESPATKRRLRNLVDASGMAAHLAVIPARPATEDELCRLHTRAYVAQIREASAGTGGEAGEGTPFGRGSYEIAALAAGGCIAAADAVLDGTVQNAYALVRPPGHHAEADRGRGYCLFGNTALAAMHARHARGLGRVAIVDWDVHHGNGTESAFYEDPSVLTISLHQEEHYPFGRGRVEDIGEGEGRGYNINVPLPAGGGRAAYEHAFDEVVEPALRAFSPDLLLVASGLDASWADPNGRMNLTAPCFARLARRLMHVADEVCGGRLALLHEGGYSTFAVAYCGLAILEELTGHRTGVDGRATVDGDPPGRPLHEHERAAVAAAAQTLETALR
jgi:acetoin utilization deacetylase AcuC-like enzyme